MSFIKNKRYYLLVTILFAFFISSCSANLFSLQKNPSIIIDAEESKNNKEIKAEVVTELNSDQTTENTVSDSQTPDSDKIEQVIVVEAPPVSDVASLNTPENEEENIAIAEEDSEEEEDALYDVPIVVNNSVEGHIEYFKSKGRDKLELWLSRSGRYIPMMKEILKDMELPEDLVYLALIESGFNPQAYSRARAAGPWQFIKSTGKRYKLKIDWWIDERRDPKKSTIAAATYLNDLYNMFGSWDLAMASYNGGEGRVQRAILKSKSDDFWKLKKTRHLKAETKNYVPKYMAATIIAKNPEEYGFDIKYLEPIQYEEVIIPESTDLRVIARCAGVSYEEIKELNPELRRWITPPNVETYTLKIPDGTKEVFLENYEKMPSDQKILWERHLVKKGETLYSIAKHYRVTVADLKKINLLSRKERVTEGTHILIPIAPNSRKASIKVTTSPILKEEKNTIYYRIRKGDTLWKISKKYNVSIASIKEWNDLDSARNIKAGDKLKLVVDTDEL
ncbi:MAG: transglycosylase SLT domain-containing protein [Nitrospirota bacterium]